MEYSNSNGRSNFPTQNIENPMVFSNNCNGIIFPKGEKYFRQELNSDR